MPLRIESLPNRATKGALLRWILDTEEVKKQQVGTIEIGPGQAFVEIPESAGPRLAKRLDGKQFNGRTTQVWFESSETDNDRSGHFAKLTRWLNMERAAESEQAAEWQRSGGDRDSSTTLTHLVIRSEDAGLGGHTLLTLSRRNAKNELPASQLAVGSPIRLAEQSQKPAPPQRGVVTRLNKLEIEIAIGKPPLAESDDPVYRIDAADDETAMLRSRSALSHARNALGDRLSELRDVCLGLREPEFDEIAEPTFEDANLNESQRKAISFANSAKDIAVIHGPPGTGKTRTLVELIRQAVAKEQKVLVCAPSNLGVDNLFERLLARGTNAVRIGHMARVLPHLQEHCLNALVPKHRDVKRIKKLRLEAAELFRKADKPSRTMERAERYALRDEARDLQAEARDMESDIAQQILDEAEVVCVTNTGIVSELLGARRFDLAVIDEACQCSEPSCWIPLLRAERLVLAGDHCQLPPTVISQEAAKEGFAVSMQERLVELYGASVCRPLLTQYRMHEDIMRFSSDQFYDGRLEADASVAAHLLRDMPDVCDDELTECAVRFIDTSGSGFEEEREPAGSSIANQEEAALAIKKAKDLIALGVPAAAIAIITPYSAQVRKLRELSDHESVEIGSVDGFQGREKEAVIISLVRSNNDHEIGFLSDTRRMNVALTRARRKLIVIGDSATISEHPFYAALLEHFDQVGAYHGVWDEE